MNETLKSFADLLEVMDELRAKCPWDKKQTFESLRHLTIEEVYELSNAILEKDMNDIKKELGDVLLHIIFYSVLGKEQNSFDIKDVIDALIAKLKYRHPHIYGDVKVENAREVEQNWEKLKIKEKGGNKSVLSGVPLNMPSIIKALRLQEKASGIGFDWQNREDIWNKIDEEINEVKKEIKESNSENTKKEFGDVLFAVINATRLYGVQPDEALELTNRKFIKRFSIMEENTIKKGIDLSKMTPKDLDNYWNEAKKNENFI